MSKIQWDKVGERFYETGVDRGVLFPMGKGGAYDKGVGWSGLTAITPELEHRKSGYVERKRRPYQGNVVRNA